MPNDQVSGSIRYHLSMMELSMAMTFRVTPQSPIREQVQGRLPLSAVTCADCRIVADHIRLILLEAHLFYPGPSDFYGK